MTETEKFSLAGKTMSFYTQVGTPKLFLSLGGSGGNFGDHAFCHFKTLLGCENLCPVSVAALGDKIVRDIRPGAAFEPTYIYRLLTVIKSSLSEKVGTDVP